MSMSLSSSSVGGARAYRPKDILDHREERAHDGAPRGARE